MFFSNFFLTFGYFLANSERPVLGCIEAKFCNEILNTRAKALDEIYKSYTYASLGEKNRIENEIMKMYTIKKYSTEKAE